MQHSRAVVLLVLLACICQRVASLAINVQADTQECFFEDLDVGDKMTVTFQVPFFFYLTTFKAIVDHRSSSMGQGSAFRALRREMYVGDGGNLDIDFWISDPAERVIKSGIRETTGTHEVIANLKGRYTYCFSNRMSSVSDKSVSFNVHDVQKQGADSVNVDPLEREIRELAESMSAVKDEQEYIVIRERQHRDTAESTNARVKWWSLGQLGLLVGVCFWQIFYLKRFFEVKRVV
ncbi:hypothetical protein INT43_003374 [Umbelopsis isabellina]|uniref:GOLD domain-containing protein n=1 Tax=Mortierella isabellina TaxID=91625 RepID=A0A8H7PQB0_MORIS|nr:hypothetical protein INT43_003374 [Umbelopsis isabellina]